MPEFELVRWHCHAKKAHAVKGKHKAHGCTTAKKKRPGVAGTRKAPARVAGKR